MRDEGRENESLKEKVNERLKEIEGESVREKEKK